MIGTRSFIVIKISFPQNFRFMTYTNRVLKVHHGKLCIFKQVLEPVHEVRLRDCLVSSYETSR